MMKFLFTPMNTLSVPKPRAMRLFSTLLVCNMSALIGVASAGIQHYQAPLETVSWHATSEKLHCALSHDVPLYGTATFAQEAGGELEFTLTAKRKANREKDRARLRALPPEWKHQVSVLDLGEVSVHKGGTPFQLKENMSRRMLAELQKGMFPTFSYRDWADARDQVTVSLPGINIKSELDKFVRCLASLPIYKFTDYEINLLHFDFGKYKLMPKYRQRLDSVARYLRSDPSVKQIIISGHTDNVGRKRSNDKLGKRRSKAVKDYLVAKGVSASLFKTKTHGERHPKATNRTNKGRAENRRAKVTLIR